MTIELDRLALRHGIRPGISEVVGRAAARLGTTPRTLRYREALGLVRPLRTRGGYRAYDERDLLAAACAADIEKRYRVPPTAVAFALRALHDPEVREEIQVLARLARHEPAPARAAALDFETRKARALLRLAS